MATKERCDRCGGPFWRRDDEWLCSQCGRPRAGTRPAPIIGPSPVLPGSRGTTARKLGQLKGR